MATARARSATLWLDALLDQQTHALVVHRVGDALELVALDLAVGDAQACSLAQQRLDLAACAARVRHLQHVVGTHPHHGVGSGQSDHARGRVPLDGRAAHRQNSQAELGSLRDAAQRRQRTMPSSAYGCAWTPP